MGLLRLRYLGRGENWYNSINILQSSGESIYYGALFFCVDNNTLDIYTHMKMRDLKQLIKEMITEEIGHPTPPQLIPDDEEELWRIIQNVPENHSIQFSVFQPQPQGLVLMFHGLGDRWGVTSLDSHFGGVDGKWHKATEILLRSLATQIYDYGENNDVYYSMVKTVPKN